VKYLLALATIAGALLIGGVASAATFEVKMLNKGSDGQMMVFEPALLKIQPGDTVKFIPTDKTHDAETIPGMRPSGAQPFKGALSQELSVTFQEPGIYGYRCAPHFGFGMVGLIEVGEHTSNLDGETDQAAAACYEADVWSVRSSFRSLVPL